MKIMVLSAIASLLIASPAAAQEAASQATLGCVNALDILARARAQEYRATDHVESKANELGIGLKLKDEGVDMRNALLKSEADLKSAIAKAVKAVGESYGAVGLVTATCTPKMLKQFRWEFKEITNYKTRLDEWLTTHLSTGMEGLAAKRRSRPDQ